MKRLLLLAAISAAVAGCVSVEGLPDPHGALAPKQRLVVDVYPSPGPWIVSSADSKAEAAAQITPIGFFVQGAEDLHTLSVSKNLQQYLPRPRLGAAVQQSLLKALRSNPNRSTDTVQTGFEAGIAQAQLADWNKSKDQLDWRQRYYAPDPDQPAPRDYARVLTLDDALILDVNVSFGTQANDDGHLLPTMSAASRVYRGDTAHLIWEHEDVASDQTSSNTITDYQMQPSMLTDSLEKLAPALGTEVAGSFLKAFGLIPSTTTAHATSTTTAQGGGLVSMSVFDHLSTATVSGVSPSSSALAGLVPAAAGSSASAPAASTGTAPASGAGAAPPSVSTPTAQGSPPPH